MISGPPYNYGFFWCPLRRLKDVFLSDAWRRSRSDPRGPSVVSRLVRGLHSKLLIVLVCLICYTTHQLL